MQEVKATANPDLILRFHTLRHITQKESCVWRFTETNLLFSTSVYVQHCHTLSVLMTTKCNNCCTLVAKASLTPSFAFDSVCKRMTTLHCTTQPNLVHVARGVCCPSHKSFVIYGTRVNLEDCSHLLTAELGQMVQLMEVSRVRPESTAYPLHVKTDMTSWHAELHRQWIMIRFTDSGFGRIPGKHLPNCRQMVQCVSMTSKRLWMWV